MIIGFGSKVGEIVSSKWDMIRNTLGDLGKPYWIQASLYFVWEVGCELESPGKLGCHLPFGCQYLEKWDMGWKGKTFETIGPQLCYKDFMFSEDVMLEDIDQEWIIFLLE